MLRFSYEFLKGFEIICLKWWCCVSILLVWFNVFIGFLVLFLLIFLYWSIWMFWWVRGVRKLIGRCISLKIRVGDRLECDLIWLCCWCVLWFSMWEIWVCCLSDIILLKFGEGRNFSEDDIVSLFSVILIWLVFD